MEIFDAFGDCLRVGFENERVNHLHDSADPRNFPCVLHQETIRTMLRYTFFWDTQFRLVVERNSGKFKNQILGAHLGGGGELVIHDSFCQLDQGTRGPNCSL